jgi:hypothetical protein
MRESKAYLSRLGFQRTDRGLVLSL